MNRSMWKTAAVVMLSAAGLVAVAADKAKNLLKEPGKTESWRLEQHEQGKGTMKEADGGILFDVTTAGTENWHVQAYLTGTDFKEGKEYTLTYKVKGEPARSIIVTAGIDEDDWHAIGLWEEFEVSKEWKDQTHTFTAENVSKTGKHRLGFVMGTGTGKVWVKDLSLTEK